MTQPYLFQPGDRVRLIDEKCPVFCGKVGTVEGYDPMVEPAPVLVRFDFWSQAACHIAEKGLVRIGSRCDGCAKRGQLGCDETCAHWSYEVAR